MRKPFFRKGVSLVLSLAMALSLGLTARAAESDGICEHHPDHTTDCGYEATGECTHECTADSGCITVSCSHTHVGTCFDAEGVNICGHACTETPACYTPTVNCVHVHGSCGHSEGKDCDFAVNGCAQCKAVTLKGTDVTLTDGTEYTYTGDEIKPHVTVMVDRLVLVEGEHYTVSYANNIGAGTGTVTVTGIVEGGYTGEVTIPFTIAKAPGTPEYTLVEIKGTDITIDGTTFPYTGEAIEPAVTVTVNSTVLTAGRDYSVTYTNNVEPGTGTVTVKGIATASETVGYTGEVSIDFTILKAQEPEAPTEPETPSEPEKPTEPETPTEPSQPEEDDKEEAKPFDYKITKGSGSKWRKDSGKNLSFTINASADDIVSIRIDGKKLNAKHYILKDDVVTLKNSWLEEQSIGTYRITVEFKDGDAQGKFTVASAADDSNPKTGDTVGVWFALMGISMAGAAVLLILGRKKLFK